MFPFLAGPLALCPASIDGAPGCSPACPPHPPGPVNTAGPNGEPVYLEGGECKLGVKVKGCNWYSDKNGKCKECAYGYTRVGSTCVVD